ncbi:hypothetical protein [Paramagnetospirillum magneticum]|uniref:hypothetical protein n=1 Tax=Paramagnetospirillum magneticum TaxID=84159 RepID=UPI000319E4CF|nr:hypothetical protein [Paramagnetospirillum magneticum]
MARLLKLVAASVLLGLWHGPSLAAVGNQQIAFSQSPAFRVIALDGGGGWCKPSVSLEATANDAAFFQGPGIARLVVALGNTILPDLCPEATSMVLRGVADGGGLVFQGTANRQNSWQLNGGAVQPKSEVSSVTSPRTSNVEPAPKPSPGQPATATQQRSPAPVISAPEVKTSSNPGPSATSYSPWVSSMGFWAAIGSVGLLGAIISILRRQFPFRPVVMGGAAFLVVGAVAGAALFHAPVSAPPSVAGEAVKPVEHPPATAPKPEAAVPSEPVKPVAILPQAPPNPTPEVQKSTEHGAIIISCERGLSLSIIENNKRREIGACPYEGILMAGPYTLHAEGEVEPGFIHSGNVSVNVVPGAILRASIPVKLTLTEDGKLQTIRLISEIINRSPAEIAWRYSPPNYSSSGTRLVTQKIHANAVTECTLDYDSDIYDTTSFRHTSSRKKRITGRIDLSDVYLYATDEAINGRVSGDANMFFVLMPIDWRAVGLDISFQQRETDPSMDSCNLNVSGKLGRIDKGCAVPNEVAVFTLMDKKEQSFILKAGNILADQCRMSTGRTKMSDAFRRAIDDIINNN